MELNKRNLAILQQLLEADDFIKLSELAEKYKVTNRTIRYDVQKISDFLEENGFPKLRTQHHKGVALKATQKLQIFLQNELKQQKTTNYFYSKEERKNIMCLMLLEQDEPMKIQDFQEYFIISKNTVLKEFDEIGIWFQNHDLILIRKPRIGIYLQGTELKRRMAMIEIIEQTIGSEELFNYAHQKTNLNKINNYKLDILFSQIDIEFLNQLVRRTELELNKQFTDEGYSNLITHISLMIKRILLDKNINLPKVKFQGLIQTREYTQAQKIVEKIEEKYNIKIPKEEVKFITIHILGSQVLKSEFIIEDGLNEIVAKMIDDFQELYEIKLGVERLELAKNLILHLRPAIYRMALGLASKNPLHEKIIKTYQTLYENIKIISIRLEEYIGFEINEHELTNITLHFGALLEKINQEKIKKNKIVLICASGIGTASMIASQIVRDYDCEVVQKISSRDLDKLKSLDYDYIISTVNIRELKEDYIKINPLLLAKDQELLKKHLKAKVHKGDEEIERLVNELLRITKNHAEIKDESQLAYEFLYALKRKKRSFKKENKEIELIDMITSKTLGVDIDAKNWQEAILKGVELLFKENKVKLEYTDRIMETINKMGPYMAICPGVFLAHAKPDNTIKETSMSIITLKKPLEFGHQEFDPIKLVITLASTDTKSHLKALSQLTNILLSNSQLEQILKADKKETIFNVIKSNHLKTRV